MNILYLTTHLNTGGITSYLLSLAGGLKKLGHNIYIASSPGELTEEFKQRGAQIFPIPIKTKSEASPKIIFSLFKLLKFIKQNHIGIIHANTRVTQVLGWLASYFSRRPYVVTCHGFFKNRLSRRLFPCWGEKVIAISEAVAAHLGGDFGVRPENIRIIHHGVDLQKYQAAGPELKAAVKRKFGLDNGPVVGIIARLSEVKGHTYLIAAMKTVLGQVPQAQLFIVGDNQNKIKEELIKSSQQLKIESRVVFCPPLNNTVEALSAMDIFVLPSLKEGLGLSLMEAMAAGLAVIGSDVGGIKNLITDGENGLLVKPKDVSGIAQGILDLLSHPEKRGYLGSRARDFINQEFSWDKMVLETERVYLECVRDAAY